MCITLGPSPLSTIGIGSVTDTSIELIWSQDPDLEPRTIDGYKIQQQTISGGLNGADISAVSVCYYVTVHKD